MALSFLFTDGNGHRWGIARFPLTPPRTWPALSKDLETGWKLRCNPRQPARSMHACMHACSSPMCCPHVGARRCREGSVLLGRMAQATNPYKKPTTLPRIPLLHRYRPTDFSFPACPAHEQRLETSSRLVVLILCAGRLFGLGRDCTILLPTPIYTRFNPVESYHTMLANYLMLKKTVEN